MGKTKVVGERVKALRESKEMTRAELAERCSLNENQITEIEEGKGVSSLSPLVHISRVLGVRIGTFLDDDQNIGPVVCRKNEEVSTISYSNNNDAARNHLKYYSLSNSKAGRHMEPFMINLAPKTDADFILSSHEGEEFIYVIEGKVEINYGQESFTIEAGDSIYYDSIVPHVAHACGDSEARILAVLYTPV